MTVLNFNAAAVQASHSHRPSPATGPDAFASYIRQHLGYAPDVGKMAHGTLVRFATSDKRGDENGWCKLFDDGEGGVFGCWRQGTSETWQARQAATPEERAAFRQKVERAREEAERKREQERAECRKRSAELWDKAQPANSQHPYLQMKRVDAHGLRILNNSLLVPVRDTAETLHGLQFISPEGSKKFKTGTAVSGCFHVIGAMQDNTLLIAEGYATGATLHEITGHAAACAFNAGNLKPVAKALREMLPDTILILCADDDYATEGNPGLTKAREAAEAVNGLLAVPSFPDTRGPKDTDSNDLAKLAGPEAVKEMITMAAQQPPPTDPPALDLLSWGAERFSGTPEPAKELVEGRFRLGAPYMLAAMGDTGKGFLLLDLFLKIATGTAEADAFGGKVKTSGTAVICSAEDDVSTFHERIANLDYSGSRFDHPGRLITVPFPNAGGVKPFAVVDRQGVPIKTYAYHQLFDAIRKLPDLCAIAFDPVQAFFTMDLNKPEYAQFVGSMLCELSAETGATTVAVHHMRKDGDIDSPAKAREAIRGSSALVDSLRGAYALWPVPEKETRKILKTLDEPFRYNAVVKGAVVKANGAADRSVTTYVRNDYGLLVDRTRLLKNHSRGNDEQLTILASTIGLAAIDGQPFVKTGINGLYARRQELPEELHQVGRDRLEALCQALLDTGKVQACLASGSTTIKWLDVPGGPFATGNGQFKIGAAGKRS